MSTTVSAIANVELIHNFDRWRITTNQIVQALKENVVLKEDFLLDTVLDSVEVKVTPATSNPTTTPSDRLILTADPNPDVVPPTKIANFKVGQKVRVYGAKLNLDSSPIVPPPIITQVTAPGLTSGTYTINYILAQFEYATGKISTSSIVSTGVGNINLDDFNDTKNIAVRFNRTSADNGILVYRKISGTGPNTTTTYNLVAVLGPKDLTTINDCLWVDYYNYDYVIWSKKNTRNEFNADSSLIHFPLTAPTKPYFGWVDTELQFVNTSTNTLTLADVCLFESECIVSHDDTSVLQQAIDDRVASGVKSIQIPTKTYFVKGLTIPSNFSIIGSGSQTTLRKLSWSSNFNDTGNRIFKSAVSLKNFSLSNLSIDGNMQNQYLLNDSALEYLNYIIDVTGDSFRYENIKINNVIGGGIYSPESVNLSLVSSFLIDSNLSDRLSYGPLNVASSSDIVLSSNIFKNFSGSVDASTVSSGTIVGNIVKNCGSGLVVYGSTNLISSPNVLMGPAGEFLPSPDIFNSAYDSININLEPNMGYTSDVYTYQENGAVVNLSSINESFVSYRIDKLQKIDNGESLYGSAVLIAGNSPIQPSYGIDVNPVQGQFKFTISQQNVNVLLSTYSYNTLKAQNPNHVGLVYRGINTEYAPSGTITALSSVINSISRSITANTTGVNSTADTIVINNIANIQTGEYWFNVGDKVYYNRPATNTAISGLTANTTYYISFANTTDIALSSSYDGANINITETRVGVGEVHALNKKKYSVVVENASNLSAGRRVKLKSHNGNPSFETNMGTIVDYSPVSRILTLAYEPTLNITSAGSGGIVLVENSYVLAKGRIL
jgi:hypothetical protein